MNKQRIFHLVVLGIVMLVSFRIAQARSLSMHFVDEEDHMTIGRLTNRGFKLYQDIQSNHQPIVYFTSAKLQQLLNPPNIFMLVRRHRQAMFVYGAIWSLLIVWRFKTVGLIFVIFFEFLKYYLFGNLWLMEAFAAYPAVYLFGTMLQVWFKNQNIKKSELVFLGICSFLVLFNLVPLWPCLAFMWLLFLLKIKKKIFWMVAALLTSTLIFFTLSRYSVADWFIRTVYNNFVYAVPTMSPLHGPGDWLKMIFFPFLAYFTPNSLQAQFISLFFSVYLLAVVFKRKLLIIYPLLLLANNRVLSPGTVYYEGFHLLPWLGLMIFTFSFCLKTIKFKFWPVWLIWAMILLTNKNMAYFWKTDPNYEYYVNYSTFDDLNFAIKIINQEGQKMAVSVLTNEVLVQWKTLTSPATKQVVSYAWERKIPALKEEYSRVFNINNPNPPEFIYGEMERELVQAKYHSLSRDGKSTGLFIRKDIYGKITPEQWEALATRRFSR
ncbi:MAG: hypothetical protein NTZ93_02710 [Candidatus Beckwithbacteria bacterium]|nr:hypothetical protein [Candidatus Beckwithbacteria bacterium]